jgi:hypothetical protein
VQGRPLPSSWPQPSDRPRPAIWSRRLIILAEPDVASPAGLAFGGALLAHPDAGAMTVIVLTAGAGFVDYAAFQPSAEPMTPERAADLMADPEQGSRLRALIGGREFDDILITAQDDDLSVIDAFAGVLPLCRTMERTRNSVLQQRAHLRTWLGRGVAPSVNAGAGHIRWTKVAQGLSGKLGEFTVRYAGPAVGRGHLIRVELAGGQPATGFASAEGRLLDPEIRFSNKARMRGEMTAALRRFGGATRLGGAAQT